MARRKTIETIWTLIVVIALSCTLAAAKEKTKKSGAIPDHPTKLQYGPLEFEVPDAADYSYKLSNGIPVFIAEDHDLPLVDLTIRLRAGAFLDPQGKPGTAAVTGTMLRRGGTTQMTAEEFDEKIDFLAANIGSYTSDLEGGASFDCITGVLDETLGLFFQMLKTPGFQDDRLQIEKDDILEAMKQRNDDPSSISRREWQWLMRGEEHFTSRALTKVELDGLSRDDLVAFHKQYWRPENMMIAISGDVQPKEMLAKLEKHFEGWKVSGPPVPWPPPAPEFTPTPGVYYVEKDIPQGRVLIGHLGLQRKNWDDPEPFAAMIMNDILGGSGFTSRLVKRIRSDEGLAYSAASGFGLGQYWPGVFRVSYQTKSETVAFAAQIALAEIESIRNDKVTAEEMNTAKSSIIDVFPRRFESAGQIVGTFLDDLYDGRPHDYWKSYRDRVAVVSDEDVRNAAKKYLKPDQLVFLIVGKREEIVPGDADGRASMAEFFDGKATQRPLRDPLTLEPLSE